MTARFDLNPSKFESNIYGVEYLLEAGVADNIGLVIPEYQRKYTWAEEDILRILVDLMNSIALRETTPASNFFGATVWCKRKRQNEPEFSLPSFDIVDGQQRISTIMLLKLSCALSIFKIHNDLLSSSSLPSPLNTWLTSQIDMIKDGVEGSTVGQLRRAPIVFPRIINENDSRGRTNTTSVFETPISQIQMEFYQALEKGTTEIDFASLRIQERDRDVFERLKNNFEIFNTHIDNIADTSFWGKFNVELIKKHKLRNKHLKDLLPSDDFPESEFDTTINTSELFEKIIRSMQLYGQLTKASCFSVISCEDEDTAFSIFDSLNTTGVPLTAIETLKPQLMRSYRDKGDPFDGSMADKNLKRVEEVIRSPGNSQEQQITLSKELVVHSILLGQGEVVNNNLNNQRTKMREMHFKCVDANELDLSSTILRNIADYREEFSFVNNIRAFNSSALSQSEIEEVQLINSFLTNSGTKLHRPILARFYWSGSDHKIFHKACRALAAFYLLRRATSVNTDRIDDKFRSSLSGTSSYNGLKIDCSNPNALTYEDLEEFKNHLKSQLSTKELEFNLSEKNKWVQHVKNMTPFSNNAKTLLRFMLFASHDGAKLDPADNTLIQRDDASPDTSTEFLKFQIWDKDTYETLEHVAPQNEKSEGWDRVYDDDDLKNTIGNFVLLPKGQNSALRDSDWPVKKLFLKTLLSDSLTERKQLVADGKSVGIKLPPKIESEVLSTNPGTALVKSHMLSGLENVNNWDADFIKKRSERLCSLCWDRIYPWIS